MYVEELQPPTEAKQKYALCSWWGCHKQTQYASPRHPTVRLTMHKLIQHTESTREWASYFLRLGYLVADFVTTNVTDDNSYKIELRPISEGNRTKFELTGTPAGNVSSISKRTEIKLLVTCEDGYYSERFSDQSCRWVPSYLW
jgi:hypothetical protein